MTAHWGVPDAAAFVGSDEDKKAQFRNTAVTLERRIDLMLSLPMSSLDSMAVQRELKLGAANDLEPSRAWNTLAVRQEGWRGRLPENPEERLAWLISLPQADLLDLLALCIALSLDAITGRDEA